MHLFSAGISRLHRPEAHCHRAERKQLGNKSSKVTDRREGTIQNCYLVLSTNAEEGRFRNKPSEPGLPSSLPSSGPLNTPSTLTCAQTNAYTFCVPSESGQAAHGARNALVESCPRAGCQVCLHWPIRVYISTCHSATASLGG